MKPSSEKFFLDTNILVYTFESLSDPRCKKARELVATALETHSGMISYQVVQEFLNVATRKFVQRMSISEVQLYLARVLMPLCAIFPASPLYSQALSIVGETGLSFYDSLIVSSAITGGCGVLLTEDLQHGQRIRGLEIRNPFRAKLP
ncbi:MAG TPA: PIN domain-containing protein [Bryobacteraceae bacterium]|nr:PIN domain-containing protein [Bryobacteraceae bacterium]